MAAAVGSSERFQPKYFAWPKSRYDPKEPIYHNCTAKSRHTIWLYALLIHFQYALQHIRVLDLSYNHLTDITPLADEEEDAKVSRHCEILLVMKCVRSPSQCIVVVRSEQACM